MSALTTAVTASCEFNCNANAPVQNLCGDNSSVQIINHTFVTVTFLPSVPWPDGRVPVIQQPGRSVLTANLSGRGITSIAPGGLGCLNSTDLYVDDDLPQVVHGVLLDDNDLSSVPDLTLFPQSIWAISIKRNGIAALDNSSLAVGSSNEELFLDLSENYIESLPQSVITSALYSYLTLNLSSNSITSIPSGALTSIGTSFHCDFSNNPINTISSNVSTGFIGKGLYASFAHCNISTLPGGLFGGNSGDVLIANFSNNHMESVGEIFSGYRGSTSASASATVDFTDNNITDASVVTTVNSFQTSHATLALDFSRNNVTSLPPYLLANVAKGSTVLANITLLLRENPITTISEFAFGSNSTLLQGYVNQLTIDFSNPTTRIIHYPTTFSFANVNWDQHAPSLLTINAANTSEQHSPLTPVLPFFRCVQLTYHVILQGCV
jgi:hypothetical protein